MVIYLVTGSILEAGCGCASSLDSLGLLTIGMPTFVTNFAVRRPCLLPYVEVFVSFRHRSHLLLFVSSWAKLRDLFSLSEWIESRIVCWVLVCLWLSHSSFLFTQLSFGATSLALARVIDIRWKPCRVVSFNHCWSPLIHGCFLLSGVWLAQVMTHSLSTANGNLWLVDRLLVLLLDLCTRGTLAVVGIEWWLLLLLLSRNLEVHQLCWLITGFEVLAVWCAATLNHSVVLSMVWD